MQGMFFTGTDTGVGKTVVVGGVARVLTRQGHTVRVCKPVATGAVQGVCEDTRLLADAVEHAQNLESITRWAFELPAAPPVAARVAGTSLQLAAIVEEVRNQDRPGSVLLVEGVGGLLCPLTEQETVADLAAALGLPLVVVTRRTLGTLNHTLLTLEAAATRRLPVAGIVVNETVPGAGPADITNVAELQRRITVPILAVVPWQGQAEVDAAAALAGVAWIQLCQPVTPTQC